MSQAELTRTAAQGRAERPWWRGSAIYQIYPWSFADSNGDGIGDLPGITDRLDYVASLGVDGVWLSPFFPSPMRDFGYDIAEYCAVDERFGTLDDFDRLLARAHQLGLKLVIDQVYSHTSERHAWFEESRASRENPRAEWYTWADPRPDGSPPNNWQSVFHGPCWTWDARRRQYYLHNFLPSQPDLNLHHPEVQEAMLDVARFWLDRGVDGFRLDAINFSMHDPELRDNPPVVPSPCDASRPFDYQHHLHNQSHPDIPKFLARLRQLMDAYPGSFSVAEVGGEQADVEMKRFTEGQDRLNSAYGFSFLYAQTLTPELIRKTMQLWSDRPGEGWPSWAFSNHDAPRAVSRWGGGRDPQAFARLTLLLLTALRGNIFLYQGEELGLPQADVPFARLRDPEAIANWPRTLGRDGARTPMPWRSDSQHGGFSTGEPWLPVPGAHRALAVDRQETDADSILNLTRRLMTLRRDRPALSQGTIRMIQAPESLVAFERSYEREQLLCVFNLGDTGMAWPLAPGWRVIAGVGSDLQPTSGFIAEWVG